nr:MAG TPA: hypothetical protein [Caudoviricetes sp.]
MAVSLGFILAVRFPLNPLFTTFLRSSAQSLIFYSYLCTKKRLWNNYMHMKSFT